MYRPAAVKRLGGLGRGREANVTPAQNPHATPTPSGSAMDAGLGSRRTAPAGRHGRGLVGPIIAKRSGAIALITRPCFAY